MDIDNLREIWQTITRNRTRSLLTAFGVFWGIFILVVLAGLGNGVENFLLKQVEGFSTNTTFVFSGQTSEPYKGYQRGRSWSMVSDDIDILKKQIPDIKYISPILSNWYGENNNVFYATKGGSYSVKGTLPEYNNIDRSKILKGRYINPTDIVNCRKVCVIGNRIYEEMIGRNEEPIGKMLKVDGVYFQIVGVIKPYSENMSMAGNNNESVILPYTTMQRVYNIGEDIYFMAITGHDDVDIKQVEEQVKKIIKDRHTIAPTDEKAISTFNVADQFKMFQYLFLGLNILIWIVGLGTLLSGIVGVSNIMLVTVKERTREIGIRRALGAKPRIIVRQIISESLLLTLLAGLVGLCIGVSIMGVIGMLFGNATDTNSFSLINPQIGFSAAIAATLIIIFSGMVAGVLPAWRAIQIKAIDAIRDE